jgi:hypothetical protein
MGKGPIRLIAQWAGKDLRYGESSAYGVYHRVVCGLVINLCVCVILIGRALILTNAIARGNKENSK